MLSRGCQSRRWTNAIGECQKKIRVKKREESLGSHHTAAVRNNTENSPGLFPLLTAIAHSAYFHDAPDLLGTAIALRLNPQPNLSLRGHAEIEHNPSGSDQHRGYHRSREYNQLRGDDDHKLRGHLPPQRHLVAFHTRCLVRPFVLRLNRHSHLIDSSSLFYRETQSHDF